MQFTRAAATTTVARGIKPLFVTRVALARIETHRTLLDAGAREGLREVMVELS